MSSQSPIKLLMMGKLDVIKDDNPSLIQGFIKEFEDVQIKKASVWSMLFIRACHFGAHRVATELMSNGLVSDLDGHEQGALRVAIRNNHQELTYALLDWGADSTIDGEHCALLAAKHGATDCLPGLIRRARLLFDGDAFSELLDKITVELTKNSFSIPKGQLHSAYENLKSEGVDLSTAGNHYLLAHAINGHRQSDMLPIIAYLAEEKLSTPGLIAAKAAVQKILKDANNIPRLRDGATYFETVRVFNKISNDRFRQRVSAEHSPQTSTSYGF